MNKFEQWMLRRIIRKEVRQDYDHDKKITALYKEIRVAVEQEFYEDNTMTRNAYLRDWFEDSLGNHARSRK